MADLYRERGPRPGFVTFGLSFLAYLALMRGTVTPPPAPPNCFTTEDTENGTEDAENGTDG